ncbi:T9SS type A sorting domain-containing protein [Flammeovirga pectinis]|uniref:T9SS type A sorting domain-containing protein n=1 Tax=Flammeovirga pectinis TaxID=2494373 RepID=A0A3Q9FMH4_9BACT|nr:glycoside hydrolase family 19 protein [Flammeovirga pectinis]AZQ61654.1 T9SS type A sorting domain-containing protein [Flammeovirga pectinis]
MNFRTSSLALLFLIIVVLLLPQKSNAQVPLTEAEYNTLFPYRYGTEQGPNGGYVFNPEKDFYKYSSLLEAVNRMKNIKVYMERREGTNLYKVTREDKTTGVKKLIRTDAGFDDSWNIQKPIISKEVDYADFLSEGTTETRKRELSAFLANLSQETTGGWATAPGGKYAWGLYFREEVSYVGTDLIGYVEQNHPDYPAVAGKSYHGRGPIQLSWNYNYGQVSQFLFGDKNILLANPEKVIEDGALAFQTAIWFWMTPQFPKPSAHDVMVGNWIPSSFDTQNGRSPGFGVTVNIINGGLECGSGTEKTKVVSRIGHYERHSEILGVSTDLDGNSSCNACGCADQKSFGGIEPEPVPQEPRISLQSPLSTQIRQSEFEEVLIKATAIDKEDNSIDNLLISVDGVELSSQGNEVTFLPTAYKSYNISITATDINAKQTSITTTIEILDPRVNCGDLWEAKVYTAGMEIVYEGVIYTAGWETKDSDIPGIADVWKLKEVCAGTTFNCNGVEEWNVLTTYQTNGMRIVYNGLLYKFNKWWSVGNQPDEDVSTWTLLGACSSSDIDNPPVLSFGLPSQSVFSDLQPIAFEINATDDKGEVNVVVSINNQEVSTTTSFSYTPASFGNYTVVAVATDNAGNSSTKEFLFTVSEAQQIAPTITFTSPINNQTIEQETLTAIAVSIAAEDQDGTVVSISTTVEGSVYEGNNFTFLPTNFGELTLSAIVTDNDGLTSEQSIVITILEKMIGGATCENLAAYSGYPSIYMNGDIVSFEGQKYECLVDNLYNVTPGTADHWWKPLGSCSSNARTLSIDNQVVDFNVYPVPFSSRVTLKIPTIEENVMVTLRNTSGIILYQEIHPTGRSFIETNHLIKGIYILTIEGDSIDLQKTIIKD